MHVLTTSEANQQIKAVIRSTVASVYVDMYDKSERTTTRVSSSNVSISNGVSTITVSFQANNRLRRDVFYSMTIRNLSEEVLYKGIAFCTDQEDLPKYDINKDRYTVEESYDNEFIFVGGDDTPSSVFSICHDKEEMATKTSAFQIADFYCVVVDEVTYDDWYVPSLDEVSVLLNNFPRTINALLEEYGYDRIPEGTVTPPFDIDLQNIWTSTEINESNSYVWRMPLYGNNIGNEQKDRPESQADLPFVVRPFRFQPSDDTLNAGDKFGGGVIAGSYTYDGVDGYLIISPTQIAGHTLWSDLGQTVTGATSESDGQSNTQIVLALENE